MFDVQFLYFSKLKYFIKELSETTWGLGAITLKWCWSSFRFVGFGAKQSDK